MSGTPVRSALTEGLSSTEDFRAFSGALGASENVASCASNSPTVSSEIIGIFPIVWEVSASPFRVILNDSLESIDSLFIIDAKFFSV